MPDNCGVGNSASIDALRTHDSILFWSVVAFGCSSVIFLHSLLQMLRRMHTWHA